MNDSGTKSRLNLTVHVIQLKLRTGSKDSSVFSTICDSRIMNESLVLFPSSKQTDYAGGKLPRNVKGPKIFLGIGSRYSLKPSIWERPV